MTSLLPISASALQHDLDEIAGPSDVAIAAIDQIPGIKYQPTDPMLPWLVWEYGLENLLPYLSDPRLALQEGVQWQRIRGTPASLNMALGWLGLDSAKVESEVPGAHFFEYQVDTGQIVPTAMLDNLKAVAGYSAPLRSRLKRLYHDYDVRRVVLDESDYGAMLSDYSGIDKDGLVLSFGRSNNSSVTVDAISIDNGASVNRYKEVKDTHWPSLDNEQIGGPKNHVIRYAHYALEQKPTSHIWSGTWDSRTWNDERYMFIGTSHHQT